MAKDFAKKFYASKAWKDTRKAYITSKHGLCEECGKTHKILILHHRIHLTPQNINDPEIALGWDNLQLQCILCHNRTHMAKYSPVKEGYGFDQYGNFIEKGE